MKLSKKPNRVWAQLKPTFSGLGEGQHGLGRLVRSWKWWLESRSLDSRRSSKSSSLPRVLFFLRYLEVLEKTKWLAFCLLSLLSLPETTEDAE
ncbi:hypothetical protein POUND7_008519 [Theobroma cacao]